jgi:hypothetical protein
LSIPYTTTPALKCNGGTAIQAVEFFANYCEASDVLISSTAFQPPSACFWNTVT